MASSFSKDHLLNLEILSFIRKQRVCVLAVEMPDGSPHAATVHFAYDEGPLVFIIQTSPRSRKAEPFNSKKECRVSMVIGVEEASNGKDTTIQIDGRAKVLKSDDALIGVYLKKYHEKIGKWPDDIFLSVVPTWWRYTDWGKSTRNPNIIEFSTSTNSSIT